MRIDLDQEGDLEDECGNVVALRPPDPNGSTALEQLRQRCISGGRWQFFL